MSIWIKALLLALCSGYLGWLLGVYHASPLTQQSVAEATVTSHPSPPATHQSCPETETLVVNRCDQTPPSDQESENFTTTEALQVGSTETNFITDNDFDVTESEYWQQQITQSANDEGKLAAIEELALRGEVAMLAEGLGDPSLEVRQATVRGLGRIGNNEAVRTLATVLFSDKDVANRMETIRVLSNLRYDPHADLFLEVAMQQDKSVAVRKAAAEALGLAAN